MLIRYGQVPEVARFRCDLEVPPARGDRVVVQTHRGRQLGEVLQMLRSDAGEESEFLVERICDADALAGFQDRRHAAASQFEDWCRRIDEWDLALELIDLEQTLDDDKLILYVLSDRGPDCTKLALQAAAAGLGTIEVQPVAAEGLVPMPSSGGGCGSGGGGCGSCG